MRTFIHFLGDHGFAVMLTGFFIAIVSLIIYMRFMTPFSPLRPVALGCFFTGIAIYVIGRITVSFKRRTMKRTSPDQEPQQRQ